MEGEDWKCPVGAGSFRSKGEARLDSIYMFLKFSDYAEFI